MSAAGQTVNGDARRDMLAKQLEGLGDEPHLAALEDSAPQPPQPESANDLPADDRPRDETGKFVAKDTKAIKVDEPELPLETSSSPATTAPVVDPPLWERPPASWNKRQDLLDPWKTADAKLREMVWTREEQMNAGVMPLKEKAKLADEITRVAEPYQNTIRGMGIDLPRAVEGLMYADNILRNAPRDQAKIYLLQLAQTYGIQLSDMAPDQAFQQVDPNIRALYNELTGLKGEVKNWQQRQEETAAASTLAEINRFAMSADYFEEARPTMIRLLESGVADDIEDAYKKAIRLDENLSGKLAERTQAQTQQTQSAAADKAAKAARTAAVSVKTSTPGAQTTTKAQDRRALLEEQFSNSEARV